MTPNQQHRLVSITGTSILAARSDPAQCPAWPVLWLQSQAPAQAGSEGLGREADCRRARSSGIPRGTLRLPASPLGGGHAYATPPSLVPVSLRALEGGFMSSCLRNALKMRSPEHFPTALNLTFPELSLGCQDFVAIFINSHRWLLPFLPWPPSYSRLGKGLGLPYRPSSLPQTHPSHPLCAPRVAQPLIYPGTPRFSSTVPSALQHWQRLTRSGTPLPGVQPWTQKPQARSHLQARKEAGS